MAPHSFADYPEPIEGPDTGYEERVDSNPVLRGIPLAVGAALYVNKTPENHGLKAV